MESLLKSLPQGDADGLLLAACDGSQSAFGSLVAPHLRSALGAAAAILGSPDDAEDVVQESMLSAWTRLRQLRAAAAFGPWFRRMVVRGAIRTAKRTRQVRVLELTPTPLPAPDSILDQVVLDAAFDRLSPKDRAVVYLRFVLDLPIDETADALGIPAGTVKSRSHYALQRLRAAYEEGSHAN